MTQQSLEHGLKSDTKQQKRSLLSRLQSKDTALQSVFWMLISCCALSMLAALGRLLGQYEVSAFQTVFCRLLFAFLVMVPLVMHQGLKTVTTAQLKTYIIRSVSGMVAASNPKRNTLDKRFRRWCIQWSNNCYPYTYCCC